MSGASYVTEPVTKGKVVLKTTLGDVDIELWGKETPRACRNFVQHALNGYYDNTIFHRVIKDFIIQGGDPTGTGEGGQSIYGEPFPGEIHQRLRFNHRGIVAMAGLDRDDNRSQFFITLTACEELNGKHTIFAKVTGDTMYNLLKVNDMEIGENDRPVFPPKILSVDVLYNPFPDIVPHPTAKKPAPAPTATKAQKPKGPPPKKDFGLLSFGTEAEQEEVVFTTTAMKMKSHHAVEGEEAKKKQEQDMLLNPDNYYIREEISALREQRKAHTQPDPTPTSSSTQLPAISTPPPSSTNGEATPAVDATSATDAVTSTTTLSETEATPAIKGEHVNAPPSPHSELNNTTQPSDTQPSTETDISVAPPTLAEAAETAKDSSTLTPAEIEEMERKRTNKDSNAFLEHMRSQINKKRKLFGDVTSINPKPVPASTTPTASEPSVVKLTKLAAVKAEKLVLKKIEKPPEPVETDSIEPPPATAAAVVVKRKYARLNRTDEDAIMKKLDKFRDALSHPAQDDWKHHKLVFEKDLEVIDPMTRTEENYEIHDPRNKKKKPQGKPSHTTGAPTTTSTTAPLISNTTAITSTSTYTPQSSLPPPHLTQNP
ncbi:peptidyl-prolyl cis-trans isomerase [Pelomyxa schiedti]|nr:peptidyl-prolyl cis-trans isomerase [Pelomyxa schiedti]